MARNRRHPAYLYIALLVVLAVVVFMFWQAISEPLFPVSDFSALPRARDVEAILRANLALRESSLEDVRLFLASQQVTSCTEEGGVMICYTAAPREFIPTGDLLRDQINYLTQKWDYKLIFTFRDDLLARIEIVKEVKSV
jgi:hypothetical protein